MPFTPELQAQIDAVKAKMGGDLVSVAGELGLLKAKLAARDGRGGFSQNVAALKERIAILEVENDEQGEG